MTLFIKGLRLKARVGVTEVERSADREIVVHIGLDYNAQPAASSDCVADAVDYRSVRDGAAAVVHGAEFRLIETIASRIVDRLATDPRILKLRVEVEKPGAMRLADSVAASLSWERGNKTSDDACVGAGQL